MIEEDELHWKRGGHNVQSLFLKTALYPSRQGRHAPALKFVRRSKYLQRHIGLSDKGGLCTGLHSGGKMTSGFVKLAAVKNAAFSKADSIKTAAIHL